MFIFDDGEHKQFLKYCFDLCKKQEQCGKILRDMGIDTTGSGIASDAWFCAYDVISHITPAHIADMDCFLDDFCEMQDFEKFYDRYYTKGEY